MLHYATHLTFTLVGGLVKDGLSRHYFSIAVHYKTRTKRKIWL